MLRGEVHDLPAGGRRIRFPLPRADDLVRADRQPEGGEHPLHVVLVLADGGGEHARTDVGHPGELQQPLEGAVLPVGAVQDGEDHVDLTERLGHRARLAVDDLAVGRVDREHHGALGGLGERRHGGQLPVRDGHPLGIVGGQRPAAVRGDADGQHVVLLTVDGAQHGAGREHGDGVLGAAAAEHDGDAGLVVGGLAAHIGLRVPADRHGVSAAAAVGGIAPGCRASRAPGRTAPDRRIPYRFSAARTSRCATSGP